MYLPAVSLMAFAGPGAHAAVMGVSNLFPSHKGFITILLTMSFHLSFAALYVVNSLWLHLRCTYHELFEGYAVVVGASMCLSLFLWPDDSFDEPLQSGEFTPLSNVSSRGTTYTAETTVESPSSSPLPNLESPSGALRSFDDRALQTRLRSAEPYLKVRDAPIWDQVLSRPFVHLFFFFVISALWANFFVGTASIQLGDLFTKTGSAELSGQLSLAMAAGSLCVPISALVLDMPKESGFPLLATLVGLTCLAWSFLQLSSSSSPNLATTSFFVYAAFRSFLYAYTYSFVADAFGSANFGLIVGVLHAASGVVSIVQLPLAWYALGTCHNATTQLAADLCTHGRWAVVQFCQALSTVWMLYVAYYDWTVRDRAKSRQDRIMRDVASYRRHSSQLVAAKGAGKGKSVEMTNLKVGRQ